MTMVRERVRAALVAHTMVAPNDRVLVAVSGGPDSLCLLHVLLSLRDQLGFSLHVGHLNHMLRAESSAEASFVAEVARSWGVPVTVETADVRRYHANLHQAARLARYQFLARTARAIEAQAVAVAHTANDQAETVLMHLLRGSGSAGLRGMLAVTPWHEWAMQASGTGPRLIRPLLGITRDAVEQYCTAHGLSPRSDPSNRDQRYTRNRIRHDLLPHLIEYNPRIIEALGRTATLCATEHEFIERALDDVWPDLTRTRPGAIDFDGTVWQRLHPALQREALRRAYRLLGGSNTLALDQVEQARALVEGGVGKRTSLPGGATLTVGYAGHFTIGEPAALDAPQIAAESAILEPGGGVYLAGGWQLRAELRALPMPRPADRWEVFLDADAVSAGMHVRGRRPADRIRPAGGPGSRRLQDLFVDRRVPQALRNGWPLLVVGDRIAWVVGLRASQEFVATPASQRVVHVRAERTSPVEEHEQC